MGKRPVVKPDWLSRTLQQRFDEKWMPEPYSGCWIWTGSANWKGYGRISYKLKPVQAQRISWFLKHGTMPPNGIDVCHHCDTPLCVNPDHLFLGTRKDNMQDMMSKGRRVYPTGYGKKWSQIRSINNPKPKNACKHGHTFNEDTIYVDKHGWISCRVCRRLQQLKRRSGMAITATRP